MAPAQVVQVVQKIPIKYGARFTQERFFLYIGIAISFFFVCLSNGTVSWYVKDWLKDDVFGDEYLGLWKQCYDRPNRGLETSCVETVGDALMNNVRSAMCLSFLLYAVVLGYLIAMQFRADLPLSHVGIALLVSAMAALFGLVLFLASTDIPRVHWLFVTSYGWSFGIGWLGMLGSMISGIVCISLPVEGLVAERYLAANQL